MAIWLSLDKVLCIVVIIVAVTSATDIHQLSQSLKEDPGNSRRSNEFLKSVLERKKDLEWVERLSHQLNGVRGVFLPEPYLRRLRNVKNNARRNNLKRRYIQRLLESDLKENSNENSDKTSRQKRESPKRKLRLRDIDNGLTGVLKLHGYKTQRVGKSILTNEENRNKLMSSERAKLTHLNTINPGKSIDLVGLEDAETVAELCQTELKRTEKTTCAVEKTSISPTINPVQEQKFGELQPKVVITGQSGYNSFTTELPNIEEAPIIPSSTIPSSTSTPNNPEITTSDIPTTIYDDEEKNKKLKKKDINEISTVASFPLFTGTAGHRFSNRNMSNRFELLNFQNGFEHPKSNAKILTEPPLKVLHFDYYKKQPFPGFSKDMSEEEMRNAAVEANKLLSVDNDFNERNEIFDDENPEREESFSYYENGGLDTEDVPNYNWESVSSDANIERDKEGQYNRRVGNAKKAKSEITDHFYDEPLSIEKSEFLLLEQGKYPNPEPSRFLARKLQSYDDMDEIEKRYERNLDYENGEGMNIVSKENIGTKLKDFFGFGHENNYNEDVRDDYPVQLRDEGNMDYDYPQSYNSAPNIYDKYTHNEEYNQLLPHMNIFMRNKLIRNYPNKQDDIQNNEENYIRKVIKVKHPMQINQRFRKSKTLRDVDGDDDCEVDDEDIFKATPDTFAELSKDLDDDDYLSDDYMAECASPKKVPAPYEKPKEEYENQVAAKELETTTIIRQEETTTPVKLRCDIPDEEKHDCQNQKPKMKDFVEEEHTDVPQEKGMGSNDTLIDVAKENCVEEVKKMEEAKEAAMKAAAQKAIGLQPDDCVSTGPKEVATVKSDDDTELLKAEAMASTPTTTTTTTTITTTTTPTPTTTPTTTPTPTTTTRTTPTTTLTTTTSTTTQIIPTSKAPCTTSTTSSTCTTSPTCSTSSTCATTTPTPTCSTSTVCSPTSRKTTTPQTTTTRTTTTTTEKNEFITINHDHTTTPCTSTTTCPSIASMLKRKSNRLNPYKHFVDEYLKKNRAKLRANKLTRKKKGDTKTDNNNKLNKHSVSGSMRLSRMPDKEQPVPLNLKKHIYKSSFQSPKTEHGSKIQRFKKKSFKYKKNIRKRNSNDAQNYLLKKRKTSTNDAENNLRKKRKTSTNDAGVHLRRKRKTSTNDAEVHLRRKRKTSTNDADNILIEERTTSTNDVEDHLRKKRKTSTNDEDNTLEERTTNQNRRYRGLKRAHKFHGNSKYDQMKQPKQLKFNLETNYLPEVEHMHRKREIMKRDQNIPQEFVHHNNENSLEKGNIIRGVLTSKIVQAIFNEVVKCNHINRTLGKGMTNDHPFPCPIANLDTFHTHEVKEDVHRLEQMLHDIMKSLNKIIEEEVKAKTCMHLDPETAKFLQFVTTGQVASTKLEYEADRYNCLAMTIPPDRKPTESYGEQKDFLFVRPTIRPKVECDNSDDSNNEANSDQQPIDTSITDQKTVQRGRTNIFGKTDSKNLAKSGFKREERARTDLAHEDDPMDPQNIVGEIPNKKRKIKSLMKQYNKLSESEKEKYSDIYLYLHKENNLLDRFLRQIKKNNLKLTKRQNPEHYYDKKLHNKTVKTARDNPWWNLLLNLPTRFLHQRTSKEANTGNKPLAHEVWALNNPPNYNEGHLKQKSSDNFMKNKRNTKDQKTSSSNKLNEWMNENDKTEKKLFFNFDK